MKFPFIKKNNMSVFGRIDLDTDKLGAFLDGIQEGKEMELIIRTKIDWNATQMKKYFEGPVVTFVQECYARKGIAFGEGSVREGLLGMFLGWTEPNQFGQKHALSRTTLDKPKDGKSPRERWIKFLQDIDDWCEDKLDCGLPSADNADVGD